MKYAAKLLTQSDLTLFASFYRENGTSKQKGINLNGDILAGELFPALPRAVTGSVEQAVVLDIYGPDAAQLLRQVRKIIKPEGGKNWRLNGKLIEAPRSEPKRFSSLAPGDVAVFGFDGDELPDSVSMVVLSQASDVDAPVLAAVVSRLALIQRSRSMVALSLSQVTSIATETLEGHPLRLLLPDETRLRDLAVAAEGDEDAAARLFSRARSGATRPVSAAELERATIRAREVGRAGEVLFNKHQERLLAAGEIRDFTWASDVNAVSPYDFDVTTNATRGLIDVKSTNGRFEAPFFISVAELRTASGEIDFSIARVFGINEAAGARMRMSAPIRDLAREILGALGGMPTGVAVGSVQIEPARLTWGIEELLPVADEEDEDDG